MKNNHTLRLNQYLASCGLCSRRAADELIRSGVVFINKEKITQLSTHVNIATDKVRVKGKLLRPQKPKYFVFYKPVKVISTLSDPLNRPTILDFLPKKKKERLFPVGRLDWNSEGLMLITNDGPLAHVIMHPKFEITKVYHVKINTLISPKKLEKLKKGVKVNNKIVIPQKVKVLPGSGPRRGRRSTQYDWLEIHIVEGQYHIIRKMMQRMDFDVKKLKRVALGRLRLGQMSAGALREIDLDKLQKIFQSTTLNLKNQKSTPLSEKTKSQTVRSKTQTQPMRRQSTSRK